MNSTVTVAVLNTCSCYSNFIYEELSSKKNFQEVFINFRKPDTYFLFIDKHFYSLYNAFMIFLIDILKKNYELYNGQDIL